MKRCAAAAVCAVRTISLFAWISCDSVNVDFRDNCLRLDGRTGDFSVASDRASGGVYVQGRMDCGRVVRAERAFAGPGSENVELVCVRGNVTNTVTITADRTGVRLAAPEGVMVSGAILSGEPDPEAVFAVRRDVRPTGLASVSGLAVPEGADAVYDRRTDSLCALDGVRIVPLTTEGRFGFQGMGTVRFSFRSGFLAERFGIVAKGVNPSCEIRTPPVGWMTWYAERFAASDAVVLRNARLFKEAFDGYTDDRPVFWVDWEWYHEKMSSHGEEGQDQLTARKTAYPRGMRAVADDLRALGFKPALWVSMLNDVKTNALWRSHPAWILGERENWSGPVWGDPTAPGYCEEFIPALAKLYRDDWGYEAFKWDTLPNVLWIYALLRERLHDPLQTPESVYRRAIAAGRRAFGPNVYLEGCAGYCDREILGALDQFDSFRVGGDIFGWAEFLHEGVARLLRYYPLHNTQFWADADNLVLRSEHSSLAQARTRVSIYALAGVPVTVGDDMSALDAPRIDLLRRAMPVVPTHPAALGAGGCPGTELDLVTDFARPFGSWQVRGWCNFSTNRVRTVAFEAPGCAVWDYWNDRLETAKAFDVAPCDTKLVRVTPIAAEGPTLVSVSRHITQGGCELRSYAADKSGARGVVRCPGRETVRVAFLLPRGAGVASASHPFDREGDVVRLRVASAVKADVSFRLNLSTQH